jgi:hypothetical protein
MSGRGRQPRSAIVGGTSSSPGTPSSTPAKQTGKATVVQSPLSRSARLAAGSTSTRSTSGSPSSRTRSLKPLPTQTKTPRGGGKGPRGSPMVHPRPVRPSPASSPKLFGNSSLAAASANVATAVGLPGPITTKRRSSAEERRKRSRRPKFQDNPPAPEIVEKKALKIVQASLDQDSGTPPPTAPNTEDEDVEEEEEEVDDDEDAALNNSSIGHVEDHPGCEISVEANKSTVSKVESNGLNHNNPEDQVQVVANGNVQQDSKKRPLTSTAEDDDDDDDDDDELVLESSKKPKLASISDAVSSLVDDIVKQIDTEPLETTEDTDMEEITRNGAEEEEEEGEEEEEEEGEEEEEEEEEEEKEEEEDLKDDDISSRKFDELTTNNQTTTTSDSADVVVNGSSGTINNLTELLRKQLKQAVKDYNLKQAVVSGDDLTLVTKLKDCLCAQIKDTVTLHQADKISISDHVAFGSDFFNDVLSSDDAKIVAMQGEVKDNLIKELVTYLEKEVNENAISIKEDTTSEIELKLDDESTTDGSLPPDLVQQVDGVDSSADGRCSSSTNNLVVSEEVKKQQPKVEKLDNNSSAEDSAAEEELIDVDDDQDPKHQDPVSQSPKKCDKLKILSEMENKFAKETQNALKNRPVYKKRNKSESWDLKNGKSASSEQAILEEIAPAATKIILMKEPGELEVVNEVMPSSHQEIVEKQQLQTNDENTPNIVSSAAAPTSSNSSPSSTLKSLRMFRKGSRTSFTLDSTENITAFDQEQDMDQGPPLIANTKGTPSKARMGPMSPPPLLTPEVDPAMPPLRIEIPDHYHHSISPVSTSSYSAGGYQRRLSIRTPPIARNGTGILIKETTVVTKEDAEMAVSAIQLSPPPAVVVPFSAVNKLPNQSALQDEYASLKTVIRLPKIGVAGANPIQMADGGGPGLSTPHNTKKVPKRRMLNVESDGGIDTEEDDPSTFLDSSGKSKKKEELGEQFDDPDKISADEEISDNGGKTTPDSQQANDDKLAE